MSQQIVELLERGDVEAAEQLFRLEPTLFDHQGYDAHPQLRAFVLQNGGHLHKPTRLHIADLLIAPNVRAFRDAILKDQLEVVRTQLRADPKLVAAEFTMGRGIGQPMHTWRAVPIAELLLDAGADIEARTTVHIDGETPLNIQLRFGSLDAVRFLLERGADPNQGLIKMMPSDTLAERVELLLAHGWNINAGADRGLLHHDALHGAGNRIRLLLDHGADPTIVDATGQTPLHIVAARGIGKAMINAFVQAGADIEAKDKLGNTPLALAQRATRQTAATELIALGATADQTAK